MEKGGAHGSQRVAGASGRGEDGSEAMISLHATRPARIARRTSWRRDPVTGGGELETSSPFSVSMGKALWVIVIIAGPPPILMLVVGLVISKVQVSTYYDSHLLRFVPTDLVSSH